MLRPLIPTIALAFMLPSPALATHAEPAKANTGKYELVSSYGQCDSPNTTTISNGYSACTPPFVGGDPCLYSLSAKAAGKLQLGRIGSVASGNQDLKIVAVAKGLDGCEGLPLNVRLSLRVTLDDCPEGSCTITDFTALDVGECVVTGGKCKINTTLNTAQPGFLPNGKNAGIQVLGCGLKGPAVFLDPPELTCGLLLK